MEFIVITDEKTGETFAREMTHRYLQAAGISSVCGIEVLSEGDPRPFLGQSQPHWDEDGWSWTIRIYPFRILETAVRYGHDYNWELRDTIKHEIAHVLHDQAMIPTVDRIAEILIKSWGSWAGSLPSSVSTIAHYRAYKDLNKGPNASHGPEWKKHARKMGAAPRAHPTF